MLVLDASVAAAWMNPDEATEATRLVYERVSAEGARVPALWLFELTNVALVSVRRGRLESAEAHMALDLITSMPVTTAAPSPATALLARAYAHGLTAYDAAYLELAVREGLPLATLDKDLRKAARKAGVTLV